MIKSLTYKEEEEKVERENDEYASHKKNVANDYFEISSRLFLSTWMRWSTSEFFIRFWKNDRSKNEEEEWARNFEDQA